MVQANGGARRAGGGRTWWAHLEFTRINITPTILPKKIEEQLIVGAFVAFSTQLGLWKSRRGGALPDGAIGADVWAGRAASSFVDTVGQNSDFAHRDVREVVGSWGGALGTYPSQRTGESV